LNRLLSLLAAATFAALPWTTAFAADHQVQMLNKDSEGRPMQFEPAFLKIAPGDTVTFVPADKTHNSESLADAIPEGGEPWKGKINEQITVTLNQEGLYGYKCMPHLALGMVGLIQVGESTANQDAVTAAKGMPAKAKARMAELVAEATGGAAAAPAN
jgi:pseudoazurin